MDFGYFDKKIKDINNNIENINNNIEKTIIEDTISANSSLDISISDILDKIFIIHEKNDSSYINSSNITYSISTDNPNTITLTNNSASDITFKIIAW